MDNEFNDLTTDNLATSFDNSPNNTQTSDELEAAAVYTDKMGTAYSIGKALSKVAVAAGLTVSVTGGVAMMTNSFIKNPPSLTDVEITPLKEENQYCLSYSFTTVNKSSYQMSFDVYEKNSQEKVFSLDVTKEDKYEGKVMDLKAQVSYHYSIAYNNGTDYSGILKEDDFLFEA